MNDYTENVFLSERLQSIADLVTPGFRVADIGTDHAYLPIRLCREDVIPSAIASDLRPGPLAIAEAHVRRAHLQDRIILRQSDGLAQFTAGEAEAMILAGMGGRLICRILEAGRPLLGSFREILLQPQSEQARVRRFCMENRLQIVQETCTEEDGKFYPVLRAVPAETDLHGLYGEAELAFGPCLLRQKDPVLQRYIAKRTFTAESILQDLRQREGDAVGRRRRELEEELQLLRAAQKCYEM